MEKYRTDLGIADADGFYAKLIDLHEGLSSEQSQKINAKMILMLANHIGEKEVLEEVLDLVIMLFSYWAFGVSLRVPGPYRLPDRPTEHLAFLGASAQTPGFLGLQCPTTVVGGGVGWVTTSSLITGKMTGFLNSRGGLLPLPNSFLSLHLFRTATATTPLLKSLVFLGLSSLLLFYCFSEKLVLIKVKAGY